MNKKLTNWVMLLLAIAPLSSYAESHDAMDTVASIVAVFVIIFAPIALISVFWMLHIFPEKEAEKKQHPQKEAIGALCIASLFFGGLLWPLAWIWANTKPVAYKLAYGRDKHNDYYLEHGVTIPTDSDIAMDTENKEALLAQINSLQNRLAMLEAPTPTSERLE